MSTLLVNTLTGASTSDSIAVTESSSVTTNLQDGLAKGWVKMDAGQNIQVSFNVSSIGDNGTGDHTVYWNNDFASVDWIPTMSARNLSGYMRIATPYSVPNAASQRVATNVATSATLVDVTSVHVIGHGDLA